MPGWNVISIVKCLCCNSVLVILSVLKLFSAVFFTVFKLKSQGSNRNENSTVLVFMVFTRISF